MCRAYPACSCVSLARGDAGIGVLVVVALVDTARGGVLLASEGVAIGGSKMAAVGLTHAVLLGGDAGLVALSDGGTARGDLAVTNAVCNAGLLARLAGVDGMALRVGGLGRSAGDWNCD